MPGLFRKIDIDNCRVPKNSRSFRVKSKEWTLNINDYFSPDLIVSIGFCQIKTWALSYKNLLPPLT